MKIININTCRACGARINKTIEKQQKNKHITEGICYFCGATQQVTTINSKKENEIITSYRIRTLKNTLIKEAINGNDD